MLVIPASPLPVALVSLVLSLVSSPLANARATPSPALGLSIPMSRRANTRRLQTLDEFAAWAESNRLGTEAKYGMGQHAKRASGVNLLTNLGADSTYFGTIAVGTPPTAFDVILDTGSADLWLASSGSNGDRATTRGIALYEPSSSSSFHDIGSTFAIRYGSGSAEGVLGSDLVQFAGFQVNQTFGLVNETSNSLLTQPISGLMGLAFQTIAASGATPLWESLADTSGALDSPLFAFQLTRFGNDSTSNQLEPGGTFTLGATNSSLFTGNIDFQDIPDGAPGYWVQELTSLNVNGQSISLPSGSDAWSAIDTGTTGVGMPANVLQEVFAAIPNSTPGTGQMQGYYTYPCDTTLDITVRWGSSSVSWPISAADFALQQTDTNVCVGSFFAINSAGTTAPPFIFGDTFLKNVYSVYRSSPKSVGFATLSSQATNMNGVDAAAPSATIGSVTSVSPTSTAGSSGSPSAAGRSTVVSLSAVLFSVLLGACTTFF